MLHPQECIAARSMHQVFGAGIANAFSFDSLRSTPYGKCHHAPRTMRGITHQLILTDRRFQEDCRGAGKSRCVAIMTISEVQAIFAIALEIRE